jgi:ubiquinone/menaquinone biosynthesis C-methylase UbiE
MTTLDYDHLAAEYARHRRVYPGLVEHLLEYSGVDGDSTVLEVGCGTANHLAAIKEATGARCVGIDPSQEMLKVAAGHGVDLELHEGRAEELDLPAGAFDLVLSVDVIHYIRRPEDYFSAAMRVVKPGGLFCTVTDSEYIIRNRRPMAEYFPATIEVDLARYHRTEVLAEKLAEAGFEDQYETMIESPYTVTDVTRFADKSYSNLHLISDEDFRSGLAALSAAVERGPVPGVLRSHVMWARRPA